MKYKKQSDLNVNNIFNRLGIILIALFLFILVTILYAKSMGEVSTKIYAKSRGKVLAQFLLSAFVSTPEVSFSAIEVDFGLLQVNKSTSQSFSIFNPSTSMAHIELSVDNMFS